MPDPTTITTVERSRVRRAARKAAVISALIEAIRRNLDSMPPDVAAAWREADAVLLGGED